MSKELKKLIGLKLDTLLPHDFNDGWTLVMRKNLSVEYKMEEKVSLTILNPLTFFKLEVYAGDIRGFVIKNIEEKERQFIKIYFENGSMIEIDMREKSYSGPEAIILECDSKIVVW